MRRVKSKHIKYCKVLVLVYSSRALKNRLFCSWKVVPCVKIITIRWNANAGKV